MEIPKDAIVNFLESRGMGDQAQQTGVQLPDQVDHENHSGLLQQVGVDPQELLSHFGGGSGGAGESSQVGDQASQLGDQAAGQFGDQASQMGDQAGEPGSQF